MKGRLQAILGGTIAAVVGMGALPAIAQQVDLVRAFTDEEWEIIEREVSVGPVRNSVVNERYEFRPSNPFVVRRGGTGRDRWAVIELSSDQFGNRYFINTQERMRVPTNMIMTYPDGREERVIEEHPVIQVVFADPAQRGGVVVRRIAMTTVCSRMQDRQQRSSSSVNHLDSLTEGPVAYADYDASGTSVASGQYSDDDRRQFEQRPEGERHISQACFAYYGYPTLVELLVRGESRGTLPSLYD